MITEVEGFIFSETPYGETSKIINVFTKEYGVIGIMCKGAKSLKNKYRTLTLKFTYAKFNIKYKKDKLSTFISADQINILTNISKDIELISYLSYLVDLTNQVLKQNNSKNLYNEFINTVLKIEDGLNPLVLTNILELKYLKYLGVGLNLDSCVSCGNKDNIITISSDKGGYICNDCLTDEKILDIKIIKMLRLYYYINISSISELKIDDYIIKSIDNFINEFYDRYTSLYLKSKEFLKNIISL